MTKKDILAALASSPDDTVIFLKDSVYGIEEAGLATLRELYLIRPANIEGYKVWWEEKPPPPGYTTEKQVKGVILS